MSVVVAAEAEIAAAALIRKVPDNLPQKVSLEDRPQHRVSNQSSRLVLLAWRQPVSTTAGREAAT